MYTIEHIFWKQYTIGQRTFPTHMLFRVVPWRPFESTATVANMPVSLGIRSLVLYFSTASKDIQGVVTNYFRTMSRRWSITSLLKFVVKNRRQASWGATVFKMNCTNITNALQESRLCWKKPIVRPGKPPWFALFLPNAKDWAILTTFDETEFRVTQVHLVGTLWRTGH